MLSGKLEKHPLYTDMEKLQNFHEFLICKSGIPSEFTFSLSSLKTSD